MNTFTTTLSLQARLICAAAAASTSFVLFSAVLANSEPQRSVLIAKTHQLEKQQFAHTAVAMLSSAKAKTGK